MKGAKIEIMKILFSLNGHYKKNVIYRLEILLAITLIYDIIFGFS